MYVCLHTYEQIVCMHECWYMYIHPYYLHIHGYTLSKSIYKSWPRICFISSGDAGMQKIESTIPKTEYHTYRCTCIYPEISLCEWMRDGSYMCIYMPMYIHIRVQHTHIHTHPHPHRHRHTYTNTHSKHMYRRGMFEESRYLGRNGNGPTEAACSTPPGST